MPLHAMLLLPVWSYDQETLTDLQLLVVGITGGTGLRTRTLVTAYRAHGEVDSAACCAPGQSRVMQARHGSTARRRCIRAWHNLQRCLTWPAVFDLYMHVPCWGEPRRQHAVSAPAPHASIGWPGPHQVARRGLKLACEAACITAPHTQLHGVHVLSLTCRIPTPHTPFQIRHKHPPMHGAVVL